MATNQQNTNLTRHAAASMVRRRPPSVGSAREGYATGNRMAAGLILADVEKYGGEGSLPVVWARMIEAKQVRRIEGPLFPATGRRAA